MSAPLFGLLLAGGRSARMGRDKAAIRYGGAPRSSARWTCSRGMSASAAHEHAHVARPNLEERAIESLGEARFGLIDDRPA